MSTERRALPGIGPGSLLLATVIAAVVVAGAGYAFSDRLDEPDYTTVVALLGAIGVAVLSFASRPAWPLSIGLGMAAFSSHWEDMSVPLPLDRLLIGTAIASILLREFAAGRTIRSRPIHWLLLVALLYVICSSILVGTLDDRQTRFVMLDRFGLVPFALFFAAPLAYRTRRDRQVLLGVFVALGGYLGITALLEEVGPRDLLIPAYIDDPSVGIHFDRARGPFAEASANGASMFACAVASAIAVFTWEGRRARGLAALVLALCMLGTLFTVTRAVWLGAVAGTVVALAWRRETRWTVTPVVALGTMLVLGAFATIPGLYDRAVERSNDDRPLWDRRNSNAAALRMFEERPLLGHGWGAFRTDSASFYQQSDDFPLTLISDLHNVFLANAAELGAIGAGLWLIALLWAIGGGMSGGRPTRGPPDLKLWRYGLLAIAVCYGVVAFSTPSTFAMPTYVLWLWAGVCWPLDEEPEEPPD